MKLSKLAAVALAILLVTAGAAAAVPGNAPAFAGNDEAQANDHSQGDENPPDHAGNASDAGNASVASSGAADHDGASAAEARGPPVDLPSAVPDHVSAIHDLIRQHLAGDLDGSLGEAIADVTPDDENDEDGEA